MLRLQLFGRVQVTGGEGRRVELETRKVALLVAVLGLRPGRTYARQALADAVWPDSDPDASRASLRVALSSLRKSLQGEADTIIASRLECSLDPELASSDTGDFFHALRGARVGGETSTELLERAVGLYSAKPLDGLEGPWVDWARSLLRKRLDEARVQWLEALVANRRFEVAARVGTEAVQRIPASEAVARHTLVALRELGRGSEAIEVYERLRQSLWERHRVAPAADLAALLPATAKPPPTAPPPSLPLALGRMVGRDAQLEELINILAPGEGGDRLVTVFGTGGIGKTRLLIEAAHRMRDAYAGRAAWTDLSSQRDPAQIVPAALAALGQRGVDSELGRLEGATGTAPFLLVLDNLEQFGTGARPHLERLLAAHRGLRVLASSRHKLGVPGERVFALEPLATQGDDLRSIPAVELFVDLADRNRPDIVWDEANLAQVAETVRALEGLPLAIRLAANKADVLSPAEIRSQVADRFRLLQDDDLELPVRQRSLWASIEWTYELLPSAKQFFTQVAQFPAPFTLEACAKVTGEADALELTQLLVRRSLLATEDRSGATRYRMLESVREFGGQMGSPEVLATLRTGFVAYYRQWADSASDELLSPNADAAMKELTAEDPNVRQAFEWALETDPNAALAIAYSMATYFDACGRYWDAIEWLDRAEEAAGDGADPELLAGVASDRSQCYVRLRRPEDAVRALEQRKELVNRVSVRAKFNFLTSLGSSSLMAGRLEQSLGHFADASRFAREAEVSSLKATGLSNEALAHMMLGQLDEAEAKANEARALSTVDGRRPNIGATLYTLAHIAMCRGETALAEDLCRESIAVLEEGGLNAALSGRFTFLSELRCTQGDLAGSLDFLHRSVDRLVRAGMERDLADCSRAAGVWCLAAGDEARAASFLSFYEPYLSAGFTGRSQADPRLSVAGMLEQGRARLRPAEFKEAVRIGKSWTIGDLPGMIEELSVPEPGERRA